MGRYLKMRLGRLFFVLFLSLVSYTIMSGVVILERALIDGIIETGGQTFIRDVIRLLGFTLVAVTLVIVSEMTTAAYTSLAAGDIRRSAFSGILRQDMAQHTAISTADKISALTNDISTIKNRFFDLFFLSFSGIVGLIAAAALMFYYQPIVALVSIITAVLMLIIPMLSGKRMAALEEKRSGQFSRLTTIVKDLLGGFEVILTFGIFKRANRRFDEVNKSLTGDDINVGRYSAFTTGIAQMFSAVCSAVILAMSCYFVVQGRMTIGTLAVFTTLQSTFTSSLTMLLQAIPIIQGIKPIAKRIGELSDTPVQAAGSITPTFHNEIVVNELGFSYQSEKPVLQGLSLKIEKGKKYALTGDNGSGKTTLVRLLCGYYHEYTGTIAYDGVELRQINKDVLYHLVSLIHQNVYLFDDTIEYNITLGEKFAENDIQKALSQSGVKDFISSFEAGLHYHVGENGVNLSGGQRQRIAVARALLRGTPLLILDEGTSSIDENMSKEIENQLLALPGLTLISITHDVSTVHLNQFDSTITLKTVSEIR